MSYGIIESGDTVQKPQGIMIIESGKIQKKEGIITQIKNKIFRRK